MRHRWIGLTLVLLATTALLAATVRTQDAQHERLNDITPLHELWRPTEGNLHTPELLVQIAVPVRTIKESSHCLPVIVWLRNTGREDILFPATKPNLLWHGTISVSNAKGTNIIEQHCEVGKHISVNVTLRRDEPRGFYINALDQGCGYRPAKGSLKPGKYTVHVAGSNQVTVEVVE